MSQIPTGDNPYESKPVAEKPDAWGESPRTSGKAIASLILSLFSVFLCGIPGIIALILGIIGLADIRASQGRLKGSGFATSGIVIAAIGFVVMLLALPVLLLLPAINAAREAARRNGCLSNVRQLALASANHEAATKRYPLGTDAIGPFAGDGAARPGAAEGDLAAGYSWQVKLLPYAEESYLYDEIRQSSEKFTIPAFDGDVTASGRHASNVQIPYFRCPSYTGDSIATAPEYLSTHGEVAVGNYVATPGTHIKADGWLDANGVFVSKWSRKDSGGKGVRISEISDGTANTIILCESREEAYASWYDGQATWVTALKSDLNETDFNASVFDNFPEAPPDSLALQVGPGDGGYFPAQRYPGQQSREWGPSSDHSGYLVLHAFADAHAQSISADVDPTVYMRLITRGGGEPANSYELDY